MSISKLHTLEKLLTNGIDVATDGDTEQLHPVAGLLIPRIQRPYAQGRSNDNINDIRRDFVENLLSALTSEAGKTLELSFVFGSMQKVNWDDARGTEAFELLDGQQRLTTLFLLHWYLYKKECASGLPEWLSRFRYETRDTSTAFLAKITDKKSSIDLSDGTKPSEAIERLIWYNNDFRCDTTVTSMLRMLDEIDEQYKNLGHQGGDLYKNLGRIQFYVRLLIGFDMPDLLFIKMNSRGLPLIPFENFKAAALKYMEKTKAYGEMVKIGNDELSPFHFYFASQIDTKWIYLFWARPASPEIGSEILLDDRQTGARFFRFFNRMLFSKLAVDYAEAAVADEKLEAACEFFRTVPETSMEQHLTDWKTQYEPAISRWRGRDDYFRQSAKVLNILSAHYASGFNLRREIRRSPFVSTSRFEMYSKIDNFTLSHRALWSVVLDFLMLLPEGQSLDSPIVAGNMRKLVRVLHNVVEHTEIENRNILDFIKAFHKILKTEGAITGDFYAALAQYDGEFAWIKAEAAKAAHICRDGGFEAIMIRAEEHPMLRGRLTPIFVFAKDAQIEADELSKRVEEFYRIFPVENGICQGIAAEYAKSESHLLIRAMLSYFTDWNKLNETNVTERGYTVRGDKKANSQYLSTILFEKGKSEQLMQDYFSDSFGKEEFEDFLSKKIEYAASLLENISGDGTRDVYVRLVTDPDAPKIYNWIKSREQHRTNNEPVIRWLRDAGILNYNGTTDDRLVLTTIRRQVIPEVLKLAGAKLEDERQGRHLERFGEYFAYEVVVNKDVNEGLTVKATFYPNGDCKVHVTTDSQVAHDVLNADRYKNESQWWHPYKKSTDAQAIAKKINDWAVILQSLASN